MEKIYFFSLSSLMKNEKALPGTVDLVRFLVRNQSVFLILTDRCNITRQRLAEKLYEAGFPLLSDEMFYNTLMASVDSVFSMYPGRRKAWYIGNEVMKETLEFAGFTLTKNAPDWLFIGTNRSATYRDYSEAMRMVQNGAKMISLSDQIVDRTARGEEPGTGAITNMLEQVTGQKALSAGWSSSILIKKAINYYETTPEEVLFVSDQLDPEIAVANACGVETVLVLEDRDIDLNASEIRPTYIVDSVRSLFR